MTEPCKKCGRPDLALRWQTFANGTRHIRGECPHCGRFSHYVPQTPEAVRVADAADAADPSPGLFPAHG